MKWAICGLGNTGPGYLNTRHNVGFMALDKLAEKLEFPAFSLKPRLQSLVCSRGDMVLFKPTTMMNGSGTAVSAVLGFYKLPPGALWVFHDDLDIGLGNFKVQKGKGPKLHNGIDSIESKLGESGFNRVRIGIDHRDSALRAKGDKYVLENFTAEEMQIIQEVINKALNELLAQTGMEKSNLW